MKLLTAFILFALSFLTFQAYAEETSKTLSFSQLKGMADYLHKDASIEFLQRQLSSYHEHSVSIRGFLYETKDHGWILSSEPNLQSCCTGSASKVAHQIHVLNLNKPENTSHAVTIEGTFAIHPVWNKEGVLTQLYTISDASITAEKSWSLSMIAFASIGILGLISLCVLLSKKLPENPSNE